ncbi:MAG: relaxase/mobilization nuclease domain-containing protein [Gammaproteobacteria bacterium]|nr:relaxase/mobilization nuclease domain-containing protein [Gammaproteobacteria bacterium]
MILKLKSSHYPTFAFHANYIDSDKGRNTENEFTISHNVIANDVDGVVQEFKQNDKFRTNPRNTVALRHEMLSFHPKDSAKITEHTLHDIAQKYIELRADDCLVFCRPHIHEKHIHLHFMISGNRFRSDKSSRLSRADFFRVRKEIERYQMEHYKELDNSVVFHKQDLEVKKNGLEYKSDGSAKAYEERTDQESLKKQAFNSIKALYEKASSREHFYELIENSNVEFYKRTIKGKEQPYGVVLGKKKCRLSRLGFDEKTLKELDQRKEQSQHLLNAFDKYGSKRKAPPKDRKGRDKGREI